MSRLHHDEGGSLPLVLLAAIMLGGVLVVLHSTVNTGITTARQDRDYSMAIQAADAGLQDAFVKLQDVPEDAPPACDTDLDGECTGTLSDGTGYRWRYVRLADRLWEVTSVGEYGGSARAVQASVGERPLFAAAIVTDQRFSYDGGGTGTTPFPVGGFNEMYFTGDTGKYIETVFLYGDNEPTGPGAPDESKWERTPGPDLPNIAEQAFLEGVCKDVTRPMTNPLVYGQVYCLRGTASFPKTTTIAGDPADGPVRVYVESGGMSVGPVEVNHGGEAVDLQIYIAAGDVVMHGNYRVSAAIYAPQSACTSNGQGGGGFAGGLVCNTVTLSGNMRYDPTINAIVDDTFAVRGWREEPGLARG